MSESQEKSGTADSEAIIEGYWKGPSSDELKEGNIGWRSTIAVCWKSQAFWTGWSM